MVLSLALQHGAPIETIRHAVTRNGSGAAGIDPRRDRRCAAGFIEGAAVMNNPPDEFETAAAPLHPNRNDISRHLFELRWNRSRHEILLIGTRGSPVCPAPGTQWDFLAIMSPRLAHSEKPKCFLEMIEQYFPNVPKIELNCRGKPRPGWDAWGNEVEEAAG